jgi:glycine/D-amino acid oxidase-like deaminating enzyme
MIDSIDYVGDVVRREAIDCGWTKSGALWIATTPAQLDRVRAGVERRRRDGLAESDVRFLSAAELTDRVRIAGVVGGTYTRHCARVHPGRLVRGLAAACERRGVRIFERSPVASIEPGRVRCAPTDRGAPMDDSPRVGVRARVVVQATEAFTVKLPGHHRDYMPVVSRDPSRRRALPGDPRRARADAPRVVPGRRPRGDQPPVGRRVRGAARLEHGDRVRSRHRTRPGREGSPVTG